MKLYINEKIFSIHNKFFVKDENGNDVYEISSKAISLGDKTTITDMGGNKIAYIEQELFHLMPNYNIYVDDNLLCKITKKFKLFKHSYELSNGYRVDGDCLMLNMDVYNDANQQIGSIKKQLFSFGDKYEIELFDEKELKIALAIIVAIANDVNRSQSTAN